jgi:hypothetical protein
MPEKITIAGKPFDVPHRYEEGHQLTAAEAKALNQIFWENLRNNFQVRVNSAIKVGAFDHKFLQDQLNDYARTYEFGSRARRGTFKDPFMDQAAKVAREKVHGDLRRDGIDPKEVQSAVITARIKEAIATNPRIMQEARRRVIEMRALAADDLQ